MNLADALTLLGGVSLFLFGMTLMGEGLKLVAGNRLEVILYKLSGTPLKGILLGSGVTAVIQSSSATSVMVVGFVNSGMMKVRQAISIIMGAIIGTSITGWIISLSDISSSSGILSLLSTETLSAITAIAGIYLRLFSKRQSHHHIGDILLGFAVLMFGMKSMSSSVSGLRESEVFITLLTRFTNPLLGIIIGLVFTTVIQSASAAVGILQALASTGAITFEIALPIIMGIAIGASVPVLLSALGATTDGKRTAFSYLVVDVLGTVVFSAIFYSLNAFLHFSFMTESLRSVNIALVNTVFRVIVVALLLPCIPLIEKLVNFLFSDKNKVIDKELEDINRLEERFLSYPPLAVENIRIAINRMGELTEKNILDAFSLLRMGYTDEGFLEVERIEGIIDKYEDSIGTYITRLTGHEMPEDLNRPVAKYLHTLTDFERISDHALNIAESAREIREKNITFTPEALHELEVTMNALERIVHLTISSFIDNDTEKAYLVEPLEEVIDNLCERIKYNHVQRLAAGKCTILNGYIFNDLTGDFERIGDHCSNTAATQIEMEDGVFGLHSYTKEVKEGHSHNFLENFRFFSETFSL